METTGVMDEGQQFNISLALSRSVNPGPLTSTAYTKAEQNQVAFSTVGPFSMARGA